MNVVGERASTFGSDFVASATNEGGQEWWVIGGSTPITHVPKSQFIKPDEAYIFHIGIVSRILDHAPDSEPDDDCYHVFVSYASEDMEFVQSLVNELTAQGLRIWWDKDELLVGDNIRVSIEKGLAQSAYGAAIISPDSIDKPWPTDERGGLYARQTSTGSPVVLPVWRGLSSEDVQSKMPMEANTQAIIVDEDDAESAAGELFRTIKARTRDEAKDVLKGQSNPSPNDTGLDDLLASHRVAYTDTQILNVDTSDSRQIQTAINRIEDEFDVRRTEDMDSDAPNTLIDGKKYIIQGKLKPTPLSEANRFFDEYGGWSEMDQNTKEDQMFIEQLRSAAGFYEMEIGDSSGKFVMRLLDEYLLEEPKRYREYTVFGEVDHVYQEDEQESYMNVLEDAADVPDRNERARMDISLRRGANALSSLPRIGEVSKSDFFISHPDVRMTPIVVYR